MKDETTATTTTTTRARRGRPYSRDFTPRGDTGKRYLLDGIPATLWASVRARARREGISVRALILQLLTAWVERADDVTLARAVVDVADGTRAESIAELQAIHDRLRDVIRANGGAA